MLGWLQVPSAPSLVFLWSVLTLVFLVFALVVDLLSVPAEMDVMVVDFQYLRGACPINLSLQGQF